MRIDARAPISSGHGLQHELYIAKVNQACGSQESKNSQNVRSIYKKLLSCKIAKMSSSDIPFTAISIDFNIDEDFYYQNWNTVSGLILN